MFSFKKNDKKKDEKLMIKSDSLKDEQTLENSEVIESEFAKKTSIMSIIFEIIFGVM